ncbi:MAG: class A beta-lactamase [Pyrinomonadaceae bacterium]
MRRASNTTLKLLGLLILTAFSWACGGRDAGPVSGTPETEEPTGELIFKEDELLQKNIAGIASEASGKVGVFALLMEQNRAVTVNGSERFALQSVVKLPVAMAVLKQAAEGKFTLDQTISFTIEDLVNPNQRSPLRDKNPNGGDATINELIRLAIVESDGSACDILTRIAGGTSAIQSFIDSLSIDEMEIKRTHKEFGKDWEMQYENWATPEAAVALLESLWNQKETAPKDADIVELRLLKYMYESRPGPNRIRGLLPPGTPVAHKTGTGGTRKGVTSATNDVGIITLPDGKHVAIAVFVGDSSADERTRERVIARIAKAVFDTWAAADARAAAPANSPN